MSIQIFDIILLVIGLNILVRSYRNGLIVSLLKIGGWLLAAYISLQDPSPIPSFLLFLGIGAGCSFLCSSIRPWLRKIPFIGWLDSLFGLGIGVCEVWLLIWVLFQIVMMLPIQNQVDQSMIYSFYKEVERYVPISRAV